MTWTRYDESANGLDPLQVIREPSTETMVSTSTDGLHWTAPVASGGSDAIEVFPSLYADQDREWHVLWLSTAMAASGSTVELRVGGSYASDAMSRTGIAGYTAHVTATTTPGIYWAVWVGGTEPRQKIRYRFRSR